MLLVDSNEPDEIVKLLKQSCPVAVSNLNLANMSDYFFANCEGKTFQYSRKQAAELLGNIDEAEQQIADYYKSADYNFQIVEGLIDDVPLKDIEMKDRTIKRVSTRPQPTIFGYRIKPDRSLEGSAFDTLHTISILYAWEHRLMMAGVPTIYVPNWKSTAQYLSAAYHNEQKPPEEHHTLQRIIRPRLHIREAEPFVKALLYLSAAYSLDIGEKRARAIAEQYVNLMDLAMSSVDEIVNSIEGIGKTTAKKLLQAIGKEID